MFSTVFSVGYVVTQDSFLGQDSLRVVTLREARVEEVFEAREQDIHVLLAKATLASPSVASQRSDLPQTLLPPSLHGASSGVE